MKIDLPSVLYFYIKTKKNGVTITVRTEYVDPIDGEILRHAVEKTVQRHEFLKLKLHKSIFAHSLRKNRRPVVVANSEKPLMLCAKETNYHFMAFRWADRNIYFDVFHGILDGTGVAMVLKTLSWYYINEKYGVSLPREGTKLLGDEIDPMEYKDYFPRSPLSVPDFIKKHQIPEYPRMNLIDLCRKKGIQLELCSYQYHVRCSEAEVMKVCKENDLSPSTLFTLAFFHAFDQVHPDYEYPLQAAIPYNMRAIFNAQNNYRNAVGNAIVTYTDKIRAMSLPQQGTAMRGQLVLATDPAAMLAGAERLRMLGTFLSKLPFSFLRRQFLHKMLTTRFPVITISYTGKKQTNDLSKYIVHSTVRVTAGTDRIVAEISCINDEFVLSFTQFCKNDVYITPFINEMKKMGVQDINIFDQNELETPQINL